MKKLNKLIYLALFAFLISACTGEKGDIGPQGPQGDAGKDGTNGVDGTKGLQGDKGATGSPGIIGTPGTPAAQTVKSSSWINFNRFEQATTAQNQFIRIRGSIQTADISTIVSGNSSNRSIIFNEFESFGTITDISGNNIYGNLYVYHKFTHNGVDVYFTNNSMNPQFDIYTGIFPSGTKMDGTLSVYFPISLNKNKTVTDLISTTTALNTAVRYVYVPLNLLNGRVATVDMSNYGEVKKAFNLQD